MDGQGLKLSAYNIQIGLESKRTKSWEDWEDYFILLAFVSIWKLNFNYYSKVVQWGAARSLILWLHNLLNALDL